MSFELLPRSSAGEQLAALAADHAQGFSATADRHDRDRSFPVENFAAMRGSGVLAATVPVELGGMGVDSVLDLTVGISRLARGDGSTAIAANMHLALTLILARFWKSAQARNAAPSVQPLEEILRGIGARKLILSCPVSEPGTDLLHIRTVASPTADGWLLRGRKAFATLAPLADVFAIPVRVPAPGEDRIMFALVPRGTPGLSIGEDWDALGMRASGSHDITLTDCQLPRAAVISLGPWGRWSSSLLAVHAAANAPLLGAFLGIAESAQHLALTAAKEREASQPARFAGRAGAVHVVAEMEIALAAMRAMLERTCGQLDGFFARHPQADAPLAEAHALMQDLQCTKWVVNRRAIEVVDQAMTLAGGAAFLSRSPLSRLYRDVRAGPFMQPFSPLEAFDYIGRLSLGIDP